MEALNGAVDVLATGAGSARATLWINMGEVHADDIS